ncbi:MAG: 2-oxo acid dehydrogenase subunit E2 [Bacteroidetes bacterium]|nr:2-oxo acid dehydrogenase subunit E2 [Bacteroidota bacterium]
MSQIDLIMPKMGESIMEATILKWLKKEGDQVEMDEPILEIATDKVDSEVPSPVDGILGKTLFEVDDTVPVGQVIATILTDSDAPATTPDATIEAPEVDQTPASVPTTAGTQSQTQTESDQMARQSPPQPATQPAGTNGDPLETPVTVGTTATATKLSSRGQNGNGFFSPLVLNIAKQENIAMEELTSLTGTGLSGRVTKKDILNYVKVRVPGAQPVQTPVEPSPVPTQTQTPPITPSAGDEIIEMDRMRKLIAEHMVRSVTTAPHVTSFVEADVTNMVAWRNKIKAEFEQREGEKITFTPIFIEAIIKAMKDFPMINSSVDGNNIIVKKDINMGLATALPSGNLIVPVIKKADQKNLVGLTKEVNDLARRARENKLQPDEISGGTFTLTNVGVFGNLMGTPIINQPESAVLATGTIKKKPVVLETEHGDVIAIRHMMFLSLSYDHRIIDGFVGGSFLRRIADEMEAFDLNRTI